jgi:hypothetical protein
MDIDWSGELDDERIEWLEGWAPRCPDGRPIVPRRLIAYREREPGRLQLRIPLSGGGGICEVVVEEDEKTVRVRALVHDDDEDGSHEFVNCPVHIYLDHPLEGREVVDVETGAALPLFVPTW